MIMRLKNNELVTQGLSQIPDDFIISQRKDTDTGLKRLIEEYNHIADAQSIYPEIDDEMSGAVLKAAINRMTFEEQLQIIYSFQAGLGKVDEHLDYDKEVKRFRLNFIRWLGYLTLFLVVAVTGGVIAAGVIRNDINTNEFIRIFMAFVNKVTDIWITGKPVID